MRLSKRRDYEPAASPFSVKGPPSGLVVVGLPGGLDLGGPPDDGGFRMTIAELIEFLRALGCTPEEIAAYLELIKSSEARGALSLPLRRAA